MSCDNVPTTAEIEQVKKDVTDFNTFMTSTSDTFVDSKSVSRLTLQGAINKFGFGTADFTFTEGGILSDRKLLVSNDPVDGFLYRYVGVGTFPVTVTAGTDPTTGTDWEAFTATSAEFISNANGGSVQDFIDAQYTTVIELATGKFQVGQYVRLTDRALGKYQIKGAGWSMSINGWDVIDAGGGNVAVYQQPVDGCHLTHIGLVTDTEDDYGALIQHALISYSIINFPEKGVVRSSPLQVQSGNTLNFHEKFTLKATSGYAWDDRLLNIFGKYNVTLNCNKSKFELLRSEYPLQEIINGNLINSEYRHCIIVVSSVNITINDPVCVNAGGDGISISGYSGEWGSGPSLNVVVNNPICDNNRRQGISVINADGVWIESPILKNTNGLPPEAGIDIEPNPLEGYFMRGIFVNNVYSENNRGGAVLVSPGLMAGYTTPVSVFVRGVVSKNDGKTQNGVIRCVPGIASTVPCPGRITIQDVVAENPASSGVFIGRWNNFAPHLVLKNIVVHNVGFDVGQNLNLYRSGLVYRTEPTDTVGNSFGNFEVDGFEVWDDRDNSGLSGTYAPVYINNAASANGIMRGVKIDNVRTYKKAAKWLSNTDFPMIITTTNVDEFEVDFGNYKIPTASAQLQQHAVGSITYVTTNSTLTLPSASKMKGATYKILVGDEVTVQIAKVGSDFIAGFNSATNGIRATQKGAYIELTASDDGTYWHITGGNPAMWVAY